MPRRAASLPSYYVLHLEYLTAEPSSGEGTAYPTKLNAADVLRFKFVRPGRSVTPQEPRPRASILSVFTLAPRERQAGSNS